MHNIHDSVEILCQTSHSAAHPEFDTIVHLWKTWGRSCGLHVSYFWIDTENISGFFAAVVISHCTFVGMAQQHNSKIVNVLM